MRKIYRLAALALLLAFPGSARSDAYCADSQLDVVAYMATWCNACRQVQRVFDEWGVVVKVHDIDKDKMSARELRKLVEVPYVPYILICGKVFDISGKGPADLLTALGLIDRPEDY